MDFSSEESSIEYQEDSSLNECPICLDIITDEFKPYQCKHLYHLECYKQLSTKLKKTCILCMSPIIKKSQLTNMNYKFNNQLDGEREFNLEYYIEKWPYKECLKKHQIIFETLGNWDWPDRSKDLKFTFKNMYIECSDCKKTIII